MSPTIVTQADFYRATGSSPRTAVEALEASLAVPFPKAPQPSSFEVVATASGAGQTKFHYTTPDGALVASFLTETADGAVYVAQSSICEHTAQEWAE